MQCIACEQLATRTAIRGDIEAAFCENHYPMEKRLVIHVYWDKTRTR